MDGLPNRPETDKDGNYADSVPSGWSGRATPTRANCSFAPAFRDYATVTVDQPDQDYTRSCICVPPDFDCDGDVDGNDRDTFESCSSGPGITWSGFCDKADFDADGDVDQADFAVFQRCYSGENVSVDANCAN